MKSLFTVTAMLLCAPAAFAYDASDCAAYVKEKKYPASYCQLTDDKSPELEVWIEGLRKVKGPIQAMEKAILADSGCEDGRGCGISFSATDRIVLSQGNDSMGGGSRIRYFLTYSYNKMEDVVYTIDVEQAVDMQSDTSIRKIGKIQKFND